MKKWSSQWRQLMQLRKEAWKKCKTSTGFESVTSWYRFHALPTELWSHWRWDQVNCGFICSRERNDIWNKSYMNCGNKMKKWRNDGRSERNLCNLRKEAWKKFRIPTAGVWTSDLAIPETYEPTIDVGCVCIDVCPRLRDLLS